MISGNRSVDRALFFVVDCTRKFQFWNCVCVHWLESADTQSNNSTYFFSISFFNCSSLARSPFSSSRELTRLFPDFALYFVQIWSLSQKSLLSLEHNFGPYSFHKSYQFIFLACLKSLLYYFKSPLNKFAIRMKTSK